MIIVNYTEEEKQELEDLLKSNGFKFVNLKDHCFPICVELEQKRISFTSTFMLRDLKKKNFKMISVEELKKIIENN